MIQLSHAFRVALVAEGNGPAAAQTTTMIDSKFYWPLVVTLKLIATNS
jgi:hypothetical protein